MILEGELAELIVKLKPSLYRKYIWKNKQGKPMLYVQLKSLIWNTTSSSFVLEIAIKDTCGMGI